MLYMVSVSSTFFYELYNKTNYLGVKKLFLFNLSILSVFFIFFKMRHF